MEQMMITGRGSVTLVLEDGRRIELRKLGLPADAPAKRFVQRERHAMIRRGKANRWDMARRAALRAWNNEDFLTDVLPAVAIWIDIAIAACAILAAWARMGG